MNTSPTRIKCLVLAMSAAATLPGCVRRTVTITTVPEGATVMLNDEAVGTTPVSRDFTWYGDYDVVIRKDGYETLHTNYRLETPWYELPGIDLIAETMIPFTIHDQQEMFFELDPAEPADREELLEQAYEFRDRTMFAEE